MNRKRMTRGFFVLGMMWALFLGTVSSLLAGEVPRAPILRIESGMHQAMINRVGVDQAGRFLVTGSFDKSIRVWNLATGELLKTLRPPIGKGNEGKIYAVAISPDGNTIACGGWTGIEWDKSCCIYLFNRENGEVVRRIAGLPEVIHHLVFSTDGRSLAAIFGAGCGLRVYRAPEYREAARDEDYGSKSLGADFSSDGRLATACLDGIIRLYDRDFKLMAKKKAPGGSQPISVAFSPDGSEIAVGYLDSTKVSVLSGRDLSFLFAPDTTGVDNGCLASVAFSADGRRLYAGGTYERKETPIRSWSEGGRGGYRDIPAAQNTIMHILPLRGGGIVYGAAGPAFGVIDSAGKRSLFVAGKTVDFRGLLEKFLISWDGESFLFGYKILGESPATFSMKERELTLEDNAPGSTLSRPRTSATGLNITDWYNKYTPALNGRPLKLEQYERSRSLAIAPDENSFLLGTEWWLRSFDREGNERWKVPGDAWAVNIAGNGRVALAALGDGTIRWYRMDDGKELMAFFPHTDKKRWVIWSSSGYYDCSPGAEDLIGWQVNNGKDQAADFYPVSRFRSAFYRPDVISKILSTLDEAEALRLANEEAGRKTQAADISQSLPPVLAILSPQEGESVPEERMTIRYRVKTPEDAPVKAVRAFIDGRPVEAARDVKLVVKDMDSLSIEVTAPSRDFELSLIAENRNGASNPARVRLRWGGKTKEEFVIQPKLYALVVGVSEYQDQNLKLRYAAKDAQDFAAVLRLQEGGLYREVRVRLLTDGKAVKDEVLDGLEWIRKETTSHDVAMVFLAGHGVNDPNGQYYFLPANADPEKLLRTGVRFSDIRETVAALPGKAVFFVDTCHSGGVMGKRRGADDLTGFINELSSAENGAVVFASSTGRQYSLEDDRWKNGAFTKALVEGFSGKADYSGKGKITINMLDLYLSERVKELTGGKQTPTTTKPETIPDFPIAVKK